MGVSVGGVLIVSPGLVGSEKCIKGLSCQNIIFLSQFGRRADFKGRSW